MDFDFMEEYGDLDLFQEKVYAIQILNSNDYSNKQFCFHCINYIEIYSYDIETLLHTYYYKNKNPKILILLYRLYSHIFSDIDISSHKILKNIKVNVITHDHWKYIYDVYFHQENLLLENYTQCTNCKIYVCPLHQKVMPFLFKKCLICKKTHWTLCSKCKFNNINYICYKCF